MTQITLISGSTLGNAEYVTEHLAEQLEAQDFSVQVLHGAQLTDVPHHGIWLIITSTHGAGDLPDNLKPLIEQIQKEHVDLSQVSYGGIGLGNRSYDTFCKAVDDVDRTLSVAGAQRIGNILKIDVSQHEIPEDPAQVWLDQWITFINN